MSVRRVVVGHDAGLMINPDGVRHQIHGNVIQSTSRALMEESSSFDRTLRDGAREWGSYPIIKFPEVPDDRRHDAAAAGPAAARRRRVRFRPQCRGHRERDLDATGVRFRELPFTPERILRGLHGEQQSAVEALPAPSPQPPLPSRIWRSPFARRTGAFATAAALCAAVVGIGAAVLPWRAIAPIARPDASVYSQATIARGQQLAALGDCAVCHTSVNGILNAGGRPLPTPFGTIYSTNITPDVDTGIGALVLSRLRARDARGHLIATAGISIRRFPTRTSPRPPTPTCRRSTLT